MVDFIVHFTIFVKFIAPHLRTSSKEGGPERITFTESDTTHQFSIDFQGNCLNSRVPQHGGQMFQKFSVYTNLYEI